MRLCCMGPTNHDHLRTLQCVISGKGFLQPAVELGSLFLAMFHAQIF